jgi:hypothetical protein
VGKRRRGGEPARAAAGATPLRRGEYVWSRTGGEAPFVVEEEPDRSRGTRAAVYTDAAPPGLLRLHRRPTVSTVDSPRFSLRRSP